jgi:hypothetical protein
MTVAIDLHVAFLCLRAARLCALLHASDGRCWSLFNGTEVPCCSILYYFDVYAFQCGVN